LGVFPPIFGNTHIVIIISQYEDSHESTSKMECHKGFLNLLNFLGWMFLPLHFMIETISALMIEMY